MQSKIVIYNRVEYKDYLIYEDGSVFSLKSNLYLKDRAHSGGYRMVTLWTPKQKECFIHRLVAFAFLPNPKRCVNHKDGNKSNNHVSNLEWVTDSENQKHSYANGLNSRNGLNNGQSKLNNEIVLEIRSSLETGVFLSKKYKVSENTIRNVRKNRSWTNI